MLMIDIIPYIHYCEAKIYQLKKSYLSYKRQIILFLQTLSTELQPDKQ